MNVTDEDWTVLTLRRLAEAVEPAAGWLPDPVAVRRRGRQIRARRLAAATGAGALVLAVAVGVPAALSTGWTTPPADPTPTEAHQEPRTFGDAQVVSLNDDVAAANLPVTTTAGTLYAPDVAGWNLTVARADESDTGAAWAGVRIGWSREYLGGGGGLTWWVSDGGADPDAYPTLSLASEGDARFLAGAVPAWLRDPIVLLYSGGGFELPDGTVATTAELPTFAAPTDDGRLLFAVALRGDAATRFGSAPWQLLVVGADGDVFVPGCGDLDVAACGTERGLAFVDIANGPVARFDGSRGASTATASPTSSADPTPTFEPSDGTTAPQPAVLGPGIAAATGLSSAAGQMAGDEGQVGTYYLAGDLNRASVRIGVGASPAPWYTVFAVIDEAVTEGALDAAATLGPTNSTVTTSLADVRDGLFEAGVTPPGAPRAFYVAVGGFETADGTLRHAFEIPTFVPPRDAAASLGPDQRMYVLGWARPATDVLLDTTSGVVFATADGTIVDPDCVGQDLDACAPYFAESGAFDEVRALLTAG